MNRFFTFVFVLFFAFSSAASVNVQAGDQVTEAGVLLTNEEAAKIVADKRVANERCDEKIDYAKKVENADSGLKIKNLETDLKAEKEKSEVIIASKEKELDRAYELLEKEQGKGNNFLIGSVVGVISAAVVSTAIFFAAVQITKMEPL